MCKKLLLYVMSANKCLPHTMWKHRVSNWRSSTIIYICIYIYIYIYILYASHILSLIKLIVT